VGQILHSQWGKSYLPSGENPIFPAGQILSSQRGKFYLPSGANPIFPVGQILYSLWGKSYIPSGPNPILKVKRWANPTSHVTLSGNLYKLISYTSSSKCVNKTSYDGCPSCCCIFVHRISKTTKTSVTLELANHHNHTTVSSAIVQYST
jgi:hypothetical protein